MNCSPGSKAVWRKAQLGKWADFGGLYVNYCPFPISMPMVFEDHAGVRSDFPFSSCILSDDSFRSISFIPPSRHPLLVCCDGGSDHPSPLLPFGVPLPPRFAVSGARPNHTVTCALYYPCPSRSSDDTRVQLTPTFPLCSSFSSFSFFFPVLRFLLFFWLFLRPAVLPTPAPPSPPSHPPPFSPPTPASISSPPSPPTPASLPSPPSPSFCLPVSPLLLPPTSILPFFTYCTGSSAPPHQCTCPVPFFRVSHPPSSMLRSVSGCYL